MQLDQNFKIEPYDTGVKLVEIYTTEPTDKYPKGRQAERVLYYATVYQAMKSYVSTVLKPSESVKGCIEVIESLYQVIDEREALERRIKGLEAELETLKSE